MKNILIALAGGDEQALDAGIDLARQLDARVTVVCVRRYPGGLVESASYQAGLRNAVRSARSVIEHALERAGDARVDAESDIRFGDPAEEILELARTSEASLIVVGSRGRGRVARAVLGSVASAVVEHAHVPVLVAGARTAAHALAA